MMQEMDLFGAGNKKEKEVVTDPHDLERVKKDGMQLEFVQNQTPEICLAAVQQNGYAIAYVKEQTTDICLAAVKQNGLALKYVKEQTPEICSAAVQEIIMPCGIQG